MMASRQDAPYLIYQRHLIKFDTRVFELEQNGISGNLLNVLTNFLCQREQKVVLNEQRLSWANVKSGFSGIYSSTIILSDLFNDLSGDLTSNTILSADGTSLLSVIQNINSAVNSLNSDLMKINDWFQWKIRFNPDPKKQAQEVIFSRKTNKIGHPRLYFNQNLVKLTSTHKHLGMVLDTKLDFSFHLKNAKNNVNETKGLIRKLQNPLHKTPLITFFKSFIRPHLDHGDMIYDQA